MDSVVISMYRSMMLTAMKSVWKRSLNLRCTSTSQSTRMRRIISFRLECRSKYSREHMFF